jgi:hypothetical protein
MRVNEGGAKASCAFVHALASMQKLQSAENIDPPNLKRFQLGKLIFGVWFGAAIIVPPWADCKRRETAVPRIMP